MMSSNHLTQKEEYEKIIIEIDHAVTGLLKCTKDLLEALTNWSIQSEHKENIHEQYDSLQSHFDKVCHAFQAANLPMDDLNHIPHDLQQCLDAALSEEPSDLEHHLPSIRDPILQLLQGLKRKQALLQETSPTTRSPTNTSTASRNLKRNMTPSTSSSSELDMMDPNTQHAFTQLRDDGDLAARSSIRRSSTMESTNDIHQSTSPATVELSAMSALSTSKIHPPARRRRGILASPSHPNLPKPPTPSPPLRRIPSTMPSSPTETESSTSPLQKKTMTKKAPDTTGPFNNSNSTLETPPLTLFLKWRSRVKRVVVETSLDSLDQVMDIFRYTFKRAFDTNTADSATTDIETTRISLLDNDTNIMYELDDINLIQSNSLLSLDDLETDDKTLVGMIEDVFKSRFDQWATSFAPISPPPPPTNGQDAALADAKAPIGAGSSLNDISGNAVLPQQLDMVHQIRNNFDVLQNAIKELQQNNEKLMAQLADYQQQERDRENQGNHQLRHSLQEMGQALTTRLETLQDTIDDMKQDVTQRRCRPSPNQLEDCHKESDAVQGMIRSLGDYLSQSKPSWKKTWEEQLQRIVGEQQCVKEYEHLVLDFEEDHSAIQTVLQHLTQVSELQKRQPQGGSKSTVMMNLGGSGCGSGDCDDDDDDGYGGRQGMGHVLQQLQTIDVDHQKRLEALAHAEKRRARDMANRIDDFEKELITFVDTNKLKKTGGAEQLERQQQEKTKQLLMNLYEKNKDT